MKDEFILYHADIPVASISFSDGIITRINEIFCAAHLPSRNSDPTFGIKDWWIHRIPNESQENSILSLENLGLSLSDSYWVMPIGKSYLWEQINLFQNGISQLNPDYSTSGRRRKHWISDKGKFKLLKQYDTLESCCNEVFASLFHKKQAQYPTLDYKIVDGASVMCDCFTSIFIESITVWDAAEQHTTDFRNDIVESCFNMGLKKEYVETYLDYIVQSDFILGNKSRHPRNISILRNPITLEAISMAPIYDNGSIFSTKEKSQVFGNNEYLLSLAGPKAVIQFSNLPELKEMKYVYSVLDDKTRLATMLDMYKSNITRLYRICEGRQ